ncbi:hypothetical protein Pmar_PMAR003536 [Perkinsus marinus ATCC 50983]|uniref:Uncharacterized protein n=1 Tax=Perkinsus marinus (strain ATCC 50983 / TXsc) TaxID=423536 RepID=C5KHL1_PERM5|nr:hypothetical protein Pmar_PMAR003536 [Perkinsus marinus ATCC 50983]EER16073.1 hypothetical protein Pmar_PMAR003536 [Perkinsus marinus ATCC 50983]|eukprot:XP_002784277.1 hypothetical protein Pmar_PMAR003536 [Perkinsus marinus ATCC 50983]
MHGEDAAFRVLSLTEEIERQVASQASLKVRLDRLRIERDRAQNMAAALKGRMLKATALPVVRKPETKNIKVGPDDDCEYDDYIDALRMEVGAV